MLTSLYSKESNIFSANKIDCMIHKEASKPDLNQT